MCGIAAIFAYGAGAPPVDRAELTAMSNAMVSRGPDDAGLWGDDESGIGLANRRLAIIDPSPAGHQPMVHRAGELVITYNREIYNFRALRRRLIEKGHRLRSQSDTEVLLHLYALYGPEMVDELRGMYALAIWDGARRGLFLARDPFGIKPLYYADDGRTMRVASQVKALRAGGRVGVGTSAAGHVGFFLWGHVPDPHTLYRDIRALPAGTTLWIDANGARPPQRFFDIAQTLADGDGRAPATLRDLLADSVRHHLVSDVPVGVFLSAGLDSGTIVALAAECGEAVLRTVTLGFDEYGGTDRDEVALAESVARGYGGNHQTRRVLGQDFEAERESLLAAMDQPTIDGVNTYFVARETAATGLKVALSGIGGDELFAGYPGFHQIPRLVRAAWPFARLPGLGRAFRFVTAPFLRYRLSPKYAGLIELGGSHGGAYLLRRGLFMPWELPDILDPEMVRDGLEELSTMACLHTATRRLADPVQKVRMLELTWYMRCRLLRDADWAGMAHSLEIRVPFVDTVLLRGLAPALAAPKPPTKRDMARTPRQPLPAALIDRPKSDFVVPVREWLLGTNRATAGERGLRGWARLVYRAQTAA